MHCVCMCMCMCACECVCVSVCMCVCVCVCVLAENTTQFTTHSFKLVLIPYTSPHNPLLLLPTPSMTPLLNSFSHTIPSFHASQSHISFQSASFFQHHHHCCHLHVSPVPLSHLSPYSSLPSVPRTSQPQQGGQGLQKGHPWDRDDGERSILSQRTLQLSSPLPFPFLFCSPCYE